jgi:uncharacterized protein (TIGR00255 family)
MTFQSMTGFAALAGGAGELAWSWEARSVNGRGLDIRVRLPEGFEVLEAPLRAELARVFSRGSITVGLKLGRGASGGLARLNTDNLRAAMEAADLVADLAAQRGLGLAPFTALDLMNLRNVLEVDAGLPSDDPIVRTALAGQIAPLAAALSAARVAEGAKLRAMLDERVTRIAELAAAARETGGARDARRGDLLRQRVAALLEATDAVDEARLAQELALLAVKADVSEEIDRLAAHVGAARELLAGGGPVGRKLDFLTQEFNREVNTLCSKSASGDLTAIGLELKVVIDQVREQVQNVE